MLYYKLYCQACDRCCSCSQRRCEVHRDDTERYAISLTMIKNWYHQGSLDVSKIRLYSSQSIRLNSAVGAFVSLNYKEKLFLVVKNQWPIEN